jgi:hypothetical protein
MFSHSIDHLGTEHGRYLVGIVSSPFNFLVSMSLLTVFVNYFIIPTLASFFLNNFNRFNTYPSRYLWYQVYWPTNLEHLLHGLLPCQLLLMLFSHFLSHRYDALLYTLLASWRLCISFALCISSSQYVCYWPIALVGRTNGFSKSSLLLYFLLFQWRTKFRKAMNKADNDASTRQIDSLINYEVNISFTNNTNILNYYAVYFYR